MKKMMMVLCAVLLIFGSYDINIIEATETANLPDIESVDEGYDEAEEYSFADLRDDMMAMVDEWMSQNQQKLLLSYINPRFALLSGTVSPNMSNNDIIRIMKEIHPCMIHPNTAQDSIAEGGWYEIAPTAFDLLCANGSVEQVKAARQFTKEYYGIDPIIYSLCVPHGMDCLIMAVSYGNTEVIKYILDNGYKNCARDSRLVRFKNGNELSCGVISAYIVSKKLKSFDPNIISMLVKHGADINEREFFYSNGNTPLINLVNRFGYSSKSDIIYPYSLADICMWMVDKLGADPRYCNASGRSAWAESPWEIKEMFEQRFGIILLPRNQDSKFKYSNEITID